MKILKHGEEKEINVVSITISEGTNPYDLKMFFCPNCGTPVFQYSGQVKQIVPWFVPSITPVLVKCPKKWYDGDKITYCNAKYLITWVI